MVATRQLHERNVLAAVFPGRDEAEAAIDALTQAGVSIDSIGAAMRRRSEEEALIETTGAHKTTEPLGDIVEGGLVGGVVGAILSFGVLSVAGVGPVIAAGILASALAGAGIGAAAGGVQAALTHLGLSEEQANALETEFNAGAAIVTVDAFDDSRTVEIARRIFAENDGKDILAATVAGVV